jgi:DNA modification methylase
MTYRLYQGDCLDVLRTMASDSLECVVTDPPYGVDLATKRAKQRGGGVTVRIGSYAHEDSPEYIDSVVVPAINECRRIARSVVVTPGTRNMWKYPEPDDMGCFYSPAGTGMGRWGFTCMQPIFYYGKDPYYVARLGSRPNSSGQTYPNDANAVDHPCAKPIRMMLWLVERASLEGMTILDPFMGSGTTGVAAIMKRRNFIGIEINPRYCAVARKRLDDAAAQLSLFTAPIVLPVEQATMFAGVTV